uniref:Enoyl reductase (ER) domain-containing protein n=1 Tax=Ciona savignyi TaxID=51511 RepID=H2ZFL7_CIOSA
MKGEMGKFAGKNDGVVMGHEFSGTVVSLGSAVIELQVGDKVCVNPNECCGVCQWGNESNPHFCESNKCVGVNMDGGWAEYCVVPKKKVYKLPDNISLLQGALAEPYSCVLRGWKQLGDLPQKDARILVQGAGIIGALFCTLLHHKGFTNVTVSEINNERRKLCTDMKLGFDVVHPQEIDLKLSGKDVDFHGFYVIIDCTGNTKAVEKAFSLCRRGATICIFGCCPAGQTMAVEPFQIYWKELKIVGCFTNPKCFDDSLTLLTELAEKGYLVYEKLGIKTFELKQYETALASLKAGTASKAVFKLGE